MSWSELHVIQNYFRVSPGPNWHVVPIGIWLHDWPVVRSQDRAALLAAKGIIGPVDTVVSCAGAMDPRKNQSNLVKAVAKIDGCALLLAGPLSDRVYGERVFRSADRLMAGRWAWLDLLPQPDMHEIFSMSDVAALPSYREPLGLVSLEAGATGCEVVVSVGSGAREYLGEEAHICEPHDPSNIADAIRDARSHPKQPGTRRRVEDYDWSVTGARMADLYRTLVGVDGSFSM
jgi:glycosyltransferase involved in cell wall biosynthesis